jgi:hypothetical protein
MSHRMPRRLTSFASPTIDELRSLWRMHASGQPADEDMRRVIFEVIRLRALVRELDGYCGAVQRLA